MAGADRSRRSRWRTTGVTPAMRAQARDATCVFQTAYELYVNERFRLR